MNPKYAFRSSLMAALNNIPTPHMALDSEPGEAPVSIFLSVPGIILGLAITGVNKTIRLKLHVLI